MGQYYKPCVLKKNYKNVKQPVISGLYSYEFGNGLKLMEHSWVGNNFVRAAMQLIAKYKGYPFVWCGDYAEGIFTDINGESANAYMLIHTITPSELEEIVKENGIEENYKYIVNYTKREYIEIPENNDDWIIHPLPLLCADGNGLDGGDYYGINMDKVGIWAYDRLGVTNKRPHYKKIKVEFKEKY